MICGARFQTDAEVFQDLPAEYRAFLASCETAVEFDADAFLFHEDEPAERFYVLLQGRIALEAHVPGRPSIVVATLRPGDLVGWSWLLPPYRTHFDAHAIESCRLIRFDALPLRQRLAKDCTFGYELYRRMTPILVARLNAARRQMIDWYGPPAEGEWRSRLPT
jgi:CRP-like cAMP-binding protein